MTRRKDPAFISFISEMDRAAKEHTGKGLSYHVAEAARSAVDKFVGQKKKPIRKEFSPQQPQPKVDKVLEAYKSLGVSPDIGAEELDIFVNALAKKFHPDVKGTGSEAKMKKINAAHEGIKDSRKK